MLGLGLALGLGLELEFGFEPSSPIVCEIVLSLTRLSFPLVRFRHNLVWRSTARFVICELVLAVQCESSSHTAGTATEK